MDLNYKLESAITFLLCVHLLSLVDILSVNCIPVNYTCDVTKAEACAAEQQKRLDKEIVSFQILSIVTNSTRDLCLSTLREDDITRCYYGNRNPCNNKAVEYLTYQWQDRINNTKALCNEVCSGYEGFAVCEQKIQYNAVNNSQWELFCSSYNQSIICANDLVSSCRLGTQLYDVLIQPWVKPYYKQLCLTGCVNLDDTMQVIEDCWNQYGDGIKQNASMCKSHTDFKRCLYLPDKVCREVEDLLQMYYDYEFTGEECRKQTTTPKPTTVTTTPSTTTFTTTPSTTTTTTVPSTTTTTTAPSTITTYPSTTTFVTETTEKRNPTTEMTTEQHTTAHAQTSKQRKETSTAVTSRQDTTPNILSTYSTKDQMKTSVSYDLLPSQKDCIQGQLMNIETIRDADIDVSLCSEIFSTLACIFNQSMDQKYSFQSQTSQLPVVIQEVASPTILMTCASVINIQKEQYIQYLNSSCVKGILSNEEDEDLPMCNGHTYGLIRCRNGAEGASLHPISVLIMTVVSSTYIAMFCL